MFVVNTKFVVNTLLTATAATLTTFFMLLKLVPPPVECEPVASPVASPVVTEEMIRLVEARTKCASELLASTPTNGSSIDRQSHLAFVKAYCEKEN